MTDDKSWTEQTLSELAVEFERMNAELDEMVNLADEEPYTGVLTAYLKHRQILTASKKGFEELLKKLDTAITTTMVMNGVTERFTVDGVGMKLVEGVNNYIGEADVRRTLSEMEFNPDQIDWFVGEVLKKTEYDYVDVRKVKDDANVNAKKK